MPEPDEQPDAPLPSRTLDPRSLRGLAHPLRIQLLRALRRHGPATASRLAERLGESSGATSYHLRQLAAHGFVTDDPTRGKGRERWWKAAHQGTNFDETLHRNPDPEVRGALDLLMHEIATIHTQEMSTWVATRHTWDEAWYGASDFSDFTLTLPPERLRELNLKIHTLIDEYRDTADPEAPGAARVRMHLHAFPQHED
ncbi:MULTISPECIES: transcriptional regulator [Streptomyces]|uniref:ArsR/SmtB family transcription factor n=1 Tax=Streptomyces TaxID=1883 RepID=UPI00093B71AD|nr:MULTISPECIES: winged helix-turn-helix domain-containing protein [Streptomyces]MBX9424973.1 winged helix-turn-helix domain-containing protein [Streptomyces lateritius]OKJ69744.1 ArsR family transcriptional regulator [Streptomyces sp. CB02261]